MEHNFQGNNNPNHPTPRSEPAVTRSDSEQSQSRKTFLLELFGGLVLVSGLLGYSVYLMLEQPPDQLAAQAKQAAKSSSKVVKPSPQVTPSPSPVPPEATSSATASPGATRSETPSTADSDQEIYQRAPKTGIYYAQNPLLNASRREIASNNGRLCIKVVNAPAAPLPGYQQILISSLSIRSNGIYVDATQEKLVFDRALTEMKDGRGRWQLLENKPDRSDMEECLAATTPYSKERQGDHIQSSTEPVVDIAEN